MSSQPARTRAPNPPKLPARARAAQPERRSSGEPVPLHSDPAVAGRLVTDWLREVEDAEAGRAPSCTADELLASMNDRIARLPK